LIFADLYHYKALAIDHNILVMNHIFKIFIIFFMFSCTGNMKKSKSVAVTPGVSKELADYRKKVISGLNYQLSFDIPEHLDKSINANVKILFNLSETGEALQIDFKEKTENLKRISINGDSVQIEHRNEHIIIPDKHLKKGNNKLEIEFIAGELSLNRNEEYLYTLLVPDRSRTVFPVFDQPNLKATFDLSLSLPKNWSAIANGELKESKIEGDKKVLRFEKSDLISTYLFSFAAGKFDEIAKDMGGVNMLFLHRETDEDKISLSLNTVFQIHKEALSFMEDYTKIKYPFQKFDFIAIPDFQYGGMEHVGAIDYKLSTLFLDKGATKDQELGRASLIAHETAHMWFGNLVTMQWFNDVWMKEVFANFMADKITKVALGDSNYDLKFLISHFPAAYSVDRTPGANPIRQDLDNLQDAGTIYGNIIYHKAPVMMRQLERLMGESAFQEGLQVYLKIYSFENSEWPDLIKILDGRTTADLKNWNQVWVNEPGRPLFTYTIEVKESKIANLSITQKAEDGSSKIWPQIFELAFVYPNEVKQITVRMNNTKEQISEAMGLEEPLFIVFNSTGMGYGVFPVDDKMLNNYFKLQDPVSRASGYITIYENMLNGGNILPKELLQFYTKSLSNEPEELNIKLFTGHIHDIYWKFITEEERELLAPELEKELWKAMENHPDANSKKLLFQTFQNIALTKGAQEKLYQVWQDQKAPANVLLTEDDFTSLALSLALRDYPTNVNILETQVMRIKNPDRQKRLMFLIPALSSEVKVRDEFFASLKKKQNREKEAWVATALGYLHHPLRTDSSEKYLKESLEILEEIQMTGDIFFPYVWLKSTFSNYQSKEAREIINEFLENHPTLNPKLKAKILQATDDLFRAGILLNKQ
jgi:aminopeptidase N